MLSIGVGWGGGVWVVFGQGLATGQWHAALPH